MWGILNDSICEHTLPTRLQSVHLQTSIVKQPSEVWDIYVKCHSQIIFQYFTTHFLWIRPKVRSHLQAKNITSRKNKMYFNWPLLILAIQQRYQDTRNCMEPKEKFKQPRNVFSLIKERRGAVGEENTIKCLLGLLRSPFHSGSDCEDISQASVL
jgi:hypothetical protein